MNTSMSVAAASATAGIFCGGEAAVVSSLFSLHRFRADALPGRDPSVPGIFLR